MDFERANPMDWQYEIQIAFDQMVLKWEKKIASEKLVTDHYVSGYTCIK